MLAADGTCQEECGVGHAGRAGECAPCEVGFYQDSTGEASCKVCYLFIYPSVSNLRNLGILDNLVRFFDIDNSISGVSERNYHCYFRLHLPGSLSPN